MEPITIYTYNRCTQYKYGGVATGAGRVMKLRGMTVPGRQFFFHTTSASHKQMGESTTTGAHRRIELASGLFFKLPDYATDAVVMYTIQSINFKPRQFETRVPIIERFWRCVLNHANHAFPWKRCPQSSTSTFNNRVDQNLGL